MGRASEFKIMATLTPSLPHFFRFAKDNRLSGIRLNPPMLEDNDLDNELKMAKSLNDSDIVPFYFDVKGRQLRVEETHDMDDHLELTLNHHISVKTPIVVLFKAADDRALLKTITENGKRLIFDGGPRYVVRKGESLHIRHPSFKIHTPPFFTNKELKRIEKAKNAGFKRYFLSYVDSQHYVDQFLEIVGKDSLVYLKIEDKKGLEFVEREFKKMPNLVLVAARGDLYIEIDKPHEILRALKLIIAKDAHACIGSRIMLSVLHEPVPSCADFSELAWLYDIGYREMLLCDSLCLQEDFLATAVNAAQEFKEFYAEIANTEAAREKTNRLIDFLKKLPKKIIHPLIDNT